MLICTVSKTLKFFQFVPILFFFRKESVKVTPRKIIRDPIRQLVVAHVTPTQALRLFCLLMMQGVHKGAA